MDTDQMRYTPCGIGASLKTPFLSMILRTVISMTCELAISLESFYKWSAKVLMWCFVRSQLLGCL